MFAPLVVIHLIITISLIWIIMSLNIPCEPSLDHTRTVESEAAETISVWNATSDALFW